MMDSGEQLERPSREEIESMCIVHAVGADGCSSDGLAERLGLSREHGMFLEQAIGPLVARGLLELRDGRVWSTEAGRKWLDERRVFFGVE